jgi:Domain of unknown function (DUF4390)
LLRRLVFFVALTALVYPTEIRLGAPHHIYTSGKFLCADLRSSENVLTDEIKDTLQYGIILTFTYTVKFIEKNIIWDDEMSEIIVRKRLWYDLWAEKYILESDYPYRQRQSFDRFSELAPEILFLRRIQIVDKRALSSEGTYYFNTRMTLKVTKLNSYYQIIYNFFSIFKYKTTFIKSKTYTGKVLKSL